MIDKFNFIKWFGESKAVDSLGNPMVYYHGSDYKFDRFDKSRMKSDGFHGKAFYFSTENLEYGKYLYKVYLRSVNPFDINGFYDVEEVKRICGERYSDIENHIESEKEYDGRVGGFIFYSFVGNQKLIEAGYDGIKHSNIFCVFESNQIKSINAKYFTQSDNIYEKKIIYKKNDNMKKHLFTTLKDFVNENLQNDITKDEIKMKSPSDKNLTNEEKKEIAKYFSKENSFELDFEKAKRELKPMELIDLLKFHGMRKKEQIHNDDMDTNPSYKVYQTEKLTKEQADVDATLFDVVEKDVYYENAKKNVNKQMITQSLRQYPNGLKEGVMIKKHPYSAAYTINIFGIDGDFVYDKGENIAEGGKQVGKLYRFTSLPIDSEDLVNSMMAYEYIKRNHERVEINTDIAKLKAYPTSSEFFKK